MDYSVVMEYVKPELLVVAVAMYIVGMIIKNSSAIKNEYIPIIIGILSIIIAALFVFATSPISTSQEILMALFTSIVQGILCASPSVFVDQTVKQTKNLKRSDTTDTTNSK